MFHMKFGENQSRPLIFRLNRIFLIFFIVISNFKISMYAEAKTKQHTFSKKELCEIVEEAIWESRFTCFFYRDIKLKKFDVSTKLPLRGS